jgi:hypothetical protein
MNVSRPTFRKYIKLSALMIKTAILMKCHEKLFLENLLKTLAKYIKLIQYLIKKIVFFQNILDIFNISPVHIIKF